MAVGPLAQVHVSVTDLDRSVAFYRDTLGIPLLFTVPSQQMAFLASGPVRLYLAVPEPGFASTAILYFRVADIDGEHARLAGLGVAMAGAPHVVHRDGSSELWMSFFADPDGNRLALMEERPAA